MNRTKFYLTVATLLIPLMPLLPYAKSGVPNRDVAAASDSAADEAAPVLPRAARDS
jgi:hypothetical protein